MIRMTDNYNRMKSWNIVLIMAMTIFCLAGCGAKGNNASDDAGIADQNIDTGQETPAEDDAGDENKKADDADMSEPSYQVNNPHLV